MQFNKYKYAFNYSVCYLYVINITTAYIRSIYYIPINDTPFDLSVFWPSDTERRIKLTFSESVSLSSKRGYVCVPASGASLFNVHCRNENQRYRTCDVTSTNTPKWRASIDQWAAFVSRLATYLCRAGSIPGRCISSGKYEWLAVP